MPYIDKTPLSSVKEAINLWEGVMHDPNIDGYNGYACFKKIIQVKWAAEKALANVPSYHEMDKWVKENRPQQQQTPKYTDEEWKEIVKQQQDPRHNQD